MKSRVLTDPYTLAGVVSILFWGTTIAFSRSLTEQLGTLTAAAAIYGLAGAAGLAAAELRARGSLSQIRQQRPAYLWVCGGLFVLYMVTLYTAIGSAANRAQVLAVGLVNYLWPGLSLLFSIWILKRKARPWLALGLVLSLAGVWMAMLSSADAPGVIAGALVTEGAATPYLLALVAAVAWALYSNLSRRLGNQEDASAVPLFLLASGLVLGILRIAHPESSTWSPSALAQLAYMAIFPGMLAYVLWDLAVRKGNLVLVATLSYLTPLLSTLVTALVLGVAPGLGLWAGAALVAVGAVICRLSLPDEAPPPDTGR